MVVNFSLNKEYFIRINKALTYIDEHLDSQLNLPLLAEVASYSPYHFHRVFKEITKETINQYIQRKRIEKAASILLRKQEISISELSLMYGFNSNSAFTRLFKNFYGISPSEFRKLSPSKFSKISKVKNKNGQVSVSFEEYICNLENQMNWIIMNSEISVKELDKMNLAYTPIIGVSNIGLGFQKLIAWAQPKGFMDLPETQMLVIYHNSFKITTPDKIRMSIAIKLKEPINSTGEIMPKIIEKGKCVVGRFELLQSEFEQAWTGLFIWLNEKGYHTANKDSFTILYNDYRQHPEKKSIVDLCIPIS